MARYCATFYHTVTKVVTGACWLVWSIRLSSVISGSWDVKMYPARTYTLLTLLLVRGRIGPSALLRKWFEITSWNLENFSWTFIRRIVPEFLVSFAEAFQWPVFFRGGFSIIFEFSGNYSVLRADVVLDITAQTESDASMVYVTSLRYNIRRTFGHMWIQVGKGEQY